MTIRSLPGGVPEPEELIGRDHLIQVLWDQLAGTNIFLIAPRRFGKTGIMRHLLKHPKPGYLPLYLEVEDLHSPEEFAGDLLAAVLEQEKFRAMLGALKAFPAALKQFVQENVEDIGSEHFRVKFRQALGESWESTAKRLLIELEKTESQLVFIIDEFPQLVENIEKRKGADAANAFLAWFRGLRMEQKDKLRRFRFVVGGSTGIDVILRKLKAADKLNDFFRLPVEPLSLEDGRRLLRDLAQHYDISFIAEAEDRFFELLGAAVPYLIHLFFAQLRLDPVSGEVSAQRIDDVYKRRVLGPGCRSYFDHYRQRLRRYGSASERAALAVLRCLAAAPGARASESVLYDVYTKARKKGATDLEFLEIMADLECDWYVSLDTATNEYFFQLEIMRAWWDRFYRSLKRK